MKKSTKIYLGPPGTGKTHKLMDIMQEELKTVPPQRIAFLSFTKKAVEEAIDRAVSRFKFKKVDFIYFKTVHSLAFNALGLKRDKIMQSKDYQKIGEHLGLEFTEVGALDGTSLMDKPRGDRYIFIHGFSRARCINPKVVWDMINHDNLNWFEYLRFEKTVTKYKNQHNMFDFADMLFIEHDPIDVDVLIIDEAQDLSTAQWKYIQRTFANVPRVYIGGDDDQAIYEWGGADVDFFIQLQGERCVLESSFRLPESVHKIAEGISSKIQHRTSKPYQSKPEAGHVEYWNDLEHIDMSTGSWLLLARNTHYLKKFVANVRDRGYNYMLKGRPGVAKIDVKAILAWEEYRKTGVLTPKDKLLLQDYTSTWNKAKIWHEAFDKISPYQLEYYVSMLRRGESLTKPPRVTISTIHGAKGGEADNVVLLTDMTATTWDAMSLNMDAEHRVWYVGATRAREALHIMMPQSRYFYQI